MENGDEFPKFECEETPFPLADEAAEMLKSADGNIKLTGEVMLWLFDECRKRGMLRPECVRLVQAVLRLQRKPNSLRTEKEHKKEPLEKVEKIDSLQEVTALLSLLEKGRNYGIADFLALLPSDSEILAHKSRRGRETAIGGFLRKLVREGELESLKGRNAAYRLPANAKD